MPSAQFDYYNFVSATVNVVTTAETIIATTRPISSSFPGATVFIQFAGQFTVGTTASALTLRIRRDNVTGTAVFTSGALTAVAANIVQIQAAATDAFAGDVASQLWVLTIVQTGATANGTAANMASSVTVGE